MQRAIRQTDRLRCLLQAYRRNCDGVAAVEFAFIAPILIVLMFGVFEMGRAYAAHRRFISATTMIGDLVSREQELTQDGLRSIYKLAPTVMGGFSSDTASLKVEVLPVQIVAAKPNEVRNYATPERFDKTKPACMVQTVTTDVKELLKLATDGVIIVNSSYVYKPLLNYPLFGSMTWSNAAAFAPRKLCVKFGDGTAAKNCQNPC